MEFDDLVDPRRPYAHEIVELKNRQEYQDAALGREAFPFWLRELFSDFRLFRPQSGGTGKEHVLAFLNHLETLTHGTLGPDELEMAPQLDDWCAIHDFDTVILIGIVTGHPNIRDGGRARTSLLLQIQPELGWARTWNRHYRLGSHSRMTFFEWQYEGKISPRMQIVEFDAKDHKA
jgi:hypothetical protein